MRRKAQAIAAIAIVGALALAGCSAGGGSGEAASVPTASINEQPRSALQEGGSLRLSITGLPTYWNTLHTNGNTVDLASDIGGFILPANWIYAGDATFEVNPNYVTEYTVQDKTDSQPQTVTLKLNPNAKWGDGTPITVADYIATWESCSSLDTGKQCASTDGFDHWSNVTQGADEFEVIVEFKDVFPDWSAALSTVYPAAGVADVDTFNEGWTTYNNDWFAGPYRVASVDDAQQVVTLERNPDWWGDTGLLDEITFRAAAPDAVSAGFANKEFDVLSGIIDGQQYAQAAARDDAEIRRSIGLQWRHFTFNGESGVLADPAVRVAIGRGVNRAAIAESDLAGIPDLVPTDLVKQNHFFVVGQDGYEPNGEAFDYDPEKAGSELDALGWVLAEGAEYREKDGQVLEFGYTMMPDVSTSKNEGELLQAQMKEIGVKVNIQNVDSDAFFDDYIIPGNFSSTAFTWQGTPYPLANINQLYGCGQDSNFTQVCVEEIDTLAAQIATTPNGDERMKLANEVDTIIWENGMILPIYNRIAMTATAANLANYGAFGMSSIRPENVGWMKADS